MKTLIIKYDMILDGEHVKMLSDTVAHGIRNGFMVLGPEFTYEVVEYDSLVVEEAKARREKPLRRDLVEKFRRINEERKARLEKNRDGAE